MRKLILLHIILLFSVLAWSQGPATDFPYQCSFETSENLSAWVLNYGTPAATDKWMFGTAVHSEGKRSLYPSADGAEPVYGDHPNVVVAYLRYKFPAATNRQVYDVSFDWKGTGNAENSKLYVMYGRDSEIFNDPSDGNYKDINKIISATSGRLSNQVENVCATLDNGLKYVCGSETWQNVSLAQTVAVPAALSSEVWNFVFIWVNANSTDTLPSSVAIDNFEITTAAIKKPQNVVANPHCEDSTMLVTWESADGANEFDLQYRMVGDTRWYGTTGITDYERNGSQCSYSLPRILEGAYDIRIRSAYYDPETSTTLHSTYVYLSNILVYCPENHCVNYIDLYSPNVTCTYGYYPDYNPGSTPYDNIGVIDYGPDAIESRHTLHVDPTEVDPRTDSLLHTVPPGALASVRLGNWDTGGEAESITYDILVDAQYQGLLIVQYAVVLEDPSHPEQPEFKLEILDESGNLIDPSCGYANFTYDDAVDKGWNLTGNVAWKDWTTIGVNLMPYDQQHIKVRFTTMDCNYSGHFGYAYFTVDCANGRLETKNCGNDAQVACYAPEGFVYEWRDETGDIKSNEQVLIVDPSEHTYTCKVSFVENPDCYFEISTFSAPRFPVPDYTYEEVYEQCSGKLKFTNTSHVMNKFDGNENHTDERCNESRWTFRSLVTGQQRTMTTWSPEYFCLDRGDTVEVTLTSYIGAEDACDSTRVDTIITRNIIPQPAELHEAVCYETGFNFDGVWYQRDTMVRSVTPNFAGCDSVTTLFLKVYPQPKDLYIHDSICSDQSVTIAGVKYTQPLDNHLIILQNKNGCDSAIYFTLTVNERLKATVDSVPYSCLDEGQMFIWMDIAAGVYDSLVIRFNTPELHDTVIYEQVTSVAIPYPETVKPGHYSADLTFYQFCCGQYAETRGFDIRYPSAIVEQKWNDVLTLLSPKYNGGYEFLSFQWYKNGIPILGENHSYLYQPLDFEAEYYVELMRADSVVMTTCPIRPVYHEQQTAYPTIVQAGQHMPMYMDHPVTIWYYTISGQLYSTFALPQGYTSLPVPDQTGAYIIKSVDSEGGTQAQVMIVE